MDSRIREIEQWVTEAKTDLGEHGREAYLNKLYLLDAEIRSVIRESGMQSATASPQSAGRRVRRQHAFPVFASGALGVLLLTVSIVYFASPGLGLPVGDKPQTLAVLPEPRLVYLPVPIGEELAIDPAGNLHLTTLPGSPSEEKAGRETTPSNEQASADGAAASPVSSKPSALAQTPPQMPVSIPASREHTIPQPMMRSEASMQESAIRDAVPSLGGSPDASLPSERRVGDQQEADSVQIVPASAGIDVNKQTVDSGDKLKLLKTDALKKQMRDELDGKIS
jgi:hypothetical protein